MAQNRATVAHGMNGVRRNIFDHAPPNSDMDSPEHAHRNRNWGAGLCLGGKLGSHIIRYDSIQSLK